MYNYSFDFSKKTTMEIVQQMNDPLKKLGVQNWNDLTIKSHHNPNDKMKLTMKKSIA